MLSRENLNYGHYFLQITGPRVEVIRATHLAGYVTSLLTTFNVDSIDTAVER